MRSLIFSLLSLFMLSCGGSPPTHTDNTQVVVHYEGKEVYRKNSKYIGIYQIRALIDRGEPFVVIFSADWCDGCTLTRGALQRAKLKTKVYYLNIDEPWVQRLASAAGIKQVPTMLHLDKNGDVLGGRVGPGAIVVYLLVRY